MSGMILLHRGTATTRRMAALLLMLAGLLVAPPLLAQPQQFAPYSGPPIRPDIRQGQPAARPSAPLATTPVITIRRPGEQPQATLPKIIIKPPRRDGGSQPAKALNRAAPAAIDTTQGAPHPFAAPPLFMQALHMLVAWMLDDSLPAPDAPERDRNLNISVAQAFPQDDGKLLRDIRVRIRFSPDPEMPWLTIEEMFLKGIRKTDENTFRLAGVRIRGLSYEAPIEDGYLIEEDMVRRLQVPLMEMSDVRLNVIEQRTPGEAGEPPETTREVLLQAGRISVPEMRGEMLKGNTFALQGLHAAISRSADAERWQGGIRQVQLPLAWLEDEETANFLRQQLGLQQLLLDVRFALEVSDISRQPQVALSFETGMQRLGRLQLQLQGLRLPPRETILLRSGKPGALLTHLQGMQDAQVEQMLQNSTLRQLSLRWQDDGLVRLFMRYMQQQAPGAPMPAIAQATTALLLQQMAGSLPHQWLPSLQMALQQFLTSPGSLQLTLQAPASGTRLTEFFQPFNGNGQAGSLQFTARANSP